MWKNEYTPLISANDDDVIGADTEHGRRTFDGEMTLSHATTK